MNSEEPIKKGWLFKQSRHFKQWRRRWVVITKTLMLTYQSEDTSGSPTEAIELKRCNAVRSADDDTKKTNSFKLEHNGESFFFYADTEKEKDAWVGVLSKLISEVNGATNKTSC